MLFAPIEMPHARLTAMWLWTLGGAKRVTAENAESAEEEEEPDEEESSPRSSASSAVNGFTLEFDAARKIAQGLGVHLERSESIVEVKGDKARLLPVIPMAFLARTRTPSLRLSPAAPSCSSAIASPHIPAVANRRRYGSQRPADRSEDRPRAGKGWMNP